MQSRTEIASPTIRRKCKRQYKAQKAASMPQHKRGRLSKEEMQKIAEASKQYKAQQAASAKVK